MEYLRESLLFPRFLFSKYFRTLQVLLLNLQTDITEVVDFTILNSEGKRVSAINVDFSTGEATIDVSHLMNGVYLLRSVDGRFSERILVQR